MTNRDKLIAVAKAEDTQDLLNHIAWTDVIKPELITARDTFNKQLVAAMLGSPLTGGITKEQLAGKAYGIDFVIRLFELILTKGRVALEDIQSIGISLT